MTEPRALVFIDGWCAQCRAAARVLARLDRCHRLSVRSFRDDERYRDAGLTPDDLLARMYVVEVATGRAHGGYGAVQVLARLLPLLWPLRPVLAVAKWTGQGDRLYDYLAARRRIIPDPRTCAVPHAPAECTDALVPPPMDEDPDRPGMRGRR
ncbi:MAG TPA: DCC1-like thiol-disulfide oxidoreductase family protein [bacterium]|nr:DCC1-like thiol-disulfide oxidoreductase family protein [bacterium]